jgi:hypothetical protein
VEPTDVIATIALALSFASAVAAGVSLVLGFREAGRREEEIRLLRDEATRRDEELGLLRQQLGEERGERLQQLRATLVPESRGASQSGGGGIVSIEYRILVASAGPYVATSVGVQLEDAEGVRVGSPSTARLAPVLMPGESGEATIFAPGGDTFTGPYRVLMEWYDGRGYQQEATELNLGRP